LVTAQNDPALLEMVTTLAFEDLRSSGRAASVTRTMPTAFVSKDAGRAATEAALQERLSRAAAEGDLPDDVDPGALARFVMVLSEGHAVHAAAGAGRADLHASIDIAMRALPARPEPATKTSTAARTRAPARPRRSPG
jgi:hypothetical protein